MKINTLKEILTEQQLKTLELVAEGLPNKRIAQRMSLSESTIKIHINNVFKKTGARNRTEAALVYLRASRNETRKQA